MTGSPKFKKQLVRNYQLDESGMYAYQLPLVTDMNTGEELSRPVTSKGRRKVESLDTIHPLHAFNSSDGVAIKKSNYMNGNGKRYDRKTMLVGGETSNGQQAVFRAESANVFGSQVEKLTISFNNTTGADATVLLGDGFNLISESLNLPVFPAGVTVGGTFGADTLKRFKDYSAGALALDLHELHIEVNNQAVYSNLDISTMMASVTNNSPRERRLYLESLVDQNAFNPTIRKVKDFRFQINQITGVRVRIPAGATVSMTFDVSAIASAHVMEQQSI